MEAVKARLGGKQRPLEFATFPSSLCWQVQVRSHPRSCCKLIFSFQDNPYFWNTVIVKEYYLDITGKRTSQCGECGYKRGPGLGVWVDASAATSAPVSPAFLQL